VSKSTRPTDLTFRHISVTVADSEYTTAITNL
jgi:hypothetical protein